MRKIDHKGPRMRLIAWNANYNNKKRSLEQDVELLRELSPDVPTDVIVISETAAPTDGNPQRAVWVGSGNPGLAVIANNELELLSDPQNLGAPRFMTGYSVRGKVNFDLLAIWPAPEKRDDDLYHETLMAALERYSHLFKRGRAIMAGDFNSNTRVSFQKKSHPEFVDAANRAGLISVYHDRTGEEHGRETMQTYRQNYSSSHVFHLDYCFASVPIVKVANLTIVNDEKWARRSDHYPLILDVDDSVVADVVQP